MIQYAKGTSMTARATLLFLLAAGCGSPWQAAAPAPTLEKSFADSSHGYRVPVEGLKAGGRFESARRNSRAHRKRGRRGEPSPLRHPAPRPGDAGGRPVDRGLDRELHPRPRRKRRALGHHPHHPGILVVGGKLVSEFVGGGFGPLR